jgi:hypothetical protein
MVESAIHRASLRVALKQRLTVKCNLYLISVYWRHGDGSQQQYDDLRCKCAPQ